jgi:hypothetical protein
VTYTADELDGETVVTTSHPSSGEDPFDLVDDAVVTFAHRRSVWFADDVNTVTLIASRIAQAVLASNWSVTRG